MVSEGTTTSYHKRRLDRHVATWCFVSFAWRNVDLLLGSLDNNECNRAIIIRCASTSACKEKWIFAAGFGRPLRALVMSEQLMIDDWI